jgi:hypothetical protein
MGDLVNKEVAFSYFYPTDRDGWPLYPNLTPQGLRYGAQSLASCERSEHERKADVRRSCERMRAIYAATDCMTPDVFAWRYLGSYASTALNYDANAAEEGTLHEVEFIAPQTRADGAIKSYPVRLAGYVLVTDDCGLPWQKALREIQIGGERGYGWGRLRLEPDGLISVDHRPVKIFDKVECRCEDSARPKICVSPKQPLLAHTRVVGVQAAGDVEPLVGRAWDNRRGAGQIVSVAEVCYAPGARLEGTQSLWFEWTTAHIWQAVGPCDDQVLSSSADSG